MSKYLYLIKKLKIKPWIKYWLIKQTEFKGVLSDILEDISFYLTDSLNMKFKIFDIIGRSVQDGDPTPENPVPIKNTGDNGSVNEKVQNKNLLPTENIDTTIARVTYKSQDDGTIIANGTKYGGNYTNFTNNTVTLETNTYSSRAFLLDGTIKKDGNDYKPEIYLINQDDNTKSYNISEIGNPGKTRNIEAGTYFIRIALWNDNIIFTNAKIGFMLVKGSTIPDEFVPHSEQNISFPLAEGQKLMEGDYLADDEKVHHVRKQVKLTGNETWHAENNCYILSSCTDVKKNDTLDKIIVISTHFPGSTTNWRDNIINGTVAKVRGSNNQIGFKLLDTFPTLDDFKTFLANNNVIIEYLLEEEQTEDFTEEQKTAWEQIKALRTYKPVTHISSEDETPAELKIQYWKEV